MDQQANYSVEIFFIALRMVLGDLPQVSSDHDIWKPAHDHTKETQEAACQLYSHTLALLGYARDRDLQHFLSVHALFDQAWYTFCEQLIQEKNSFGCSWYGFIQINTIVNELKSSRNKISPYQDVKDKMATITKAIFFNPETPKKIKDLIHLHLAKMNSPYTAVIRCSDRDSSNIIAQAIESSIKNPKNRDCLDRSMGENPMALIPTIVRVALIHYCSQEWHQLSQPKIFTPYDQMILPIRKTVRDILAVCPDAGPCFLEMAAMSGKYCREIPADFCPKLEKIAHLVIKKNTNFIYGLVQNRIRLEKFQLLPKTLRNVLLTQRILELGFKHFEMEKGLIGIAERTVLS